MNQQVFLKAFDKLTNVSDDGKVTLDGEDLMYTLPTLLAMSREGNAPAWRSIERNYPKPVNTVNELFFYAHALITDLKEGNGRAKALVQDLINEQVPSSFATSSLTEEEDPVTVLVEALKRELTELS